MAAAEARDSGLGLRVGAEPRTAESAGRVRVFEPRLLSLKCLPGVLELRTGKAAGLVTGKALLKTPPVGGSTQTGLGGTRC